MVSPGLVEQHAVTADAEPEQSFEVAAEWLNSTFARFGIAVQRGQDAHRGFALDGSDLRRHVGLEADFLHSSLLLRIWSMVKPRSATTCSNETPSPPFSKYSREAATARRSSSVSSS